MTHSLLFGVRRAGVDDTAAALAARLSCTFQARDSDYLGHYRKASTGSADIRVVAQPDPDGDPLEDAFADYATLIYVETAGEAPPLAGLAVADEVVDRLM
jgi:hypothetical protein